jgi:hypothetical protein
MRALLLTGPFSDSDFAELMTAMRAIERRAPQNTYCATTVELPGETEGRAGVDTAFDYLDKIFPHAAGLGHERLHLTVAAGRAMIDALWLFLQTYAHTAAHPTPAQEAAVIIAARAALAAARSERKEGKLTEGDPMKDKARPGPRPGFSAATPYRIGQDPRLPPQTRSPGGRRRQDRPRQAGTDL